VPVAHCLAVEPNRYVDSLVMEEQMTRIVAQAGDLHLAVAIVVVAAAGTAEVAGAAAADRFEDMVALRVAVVVVACLLHSDSEL